MVKQESTAPPPARRGMDIMSLLNSDPPAPRAQTVPPVDPSKHSPASDATEEDRQPSKAGTWSAPPIRHDRPSTASTVVDSVLPHWATTTLKGPPYPSASYTQLEAGRPTRPSSASSAPAPVYFEQKYRSSPSAYPPLGHRQDPYLHASPHPTAGVGHPTPLWQPQPAPAYASRFSQTAVQGQNTALVYRQEMRDRPPPMPQDPQMSYGRPAIPSLTPFSLSRGAAPHDGRTSR